MNDITTKMWSTRLARSKAERQLLRSTEDPDEGVSVSIWDTLEDMRSYETGEFRQKIAQEVENLYRGEYWVKHFEVADSQQ